MSEKIMECILCGCTDVDCLQCIEVQGYPCHWVRPYLCSRCAQNNEEWFICFNCFDKADDGDQYVYPISELSNPEQDKEFWLCKECYLDEVNEKHRDNEDLCSDISFVV